MTTTESTTVDDSHSTTQPDDEDYDPEDYGMY